MQKLSSAFWGIDNFRFYWELSQTKFADNIFAKIQKFVIDSLRKICYNKRGEFAYNIFCLLSTAELTIISQEVNKENEKHNIK